MGHLERTGIRILCAALVLAVMACIKPLITMAIDWGSHGAFVVMIGALFAIGFAIERRDRQRPPPL